MSALSPPPSTQGRRCLIGGSVNDKHLLLQQQLPLVRFAPTAFAVSYVAYCVVYMIRKPISVVKPVLQSELGLTTSQLGAVDTAWLALYALGQLSLGRLSASMSPQQLVALSFVAAGVATAACSLVQDAMSLAVLWGINGFCQAPINPLLVLFVSDLFPVAQRSTMIGAWQTSMQVGGVSANFFAATMLRFGWRSIFALGGLVAAAFAAPMYALLTAGGPPVAKKATMAKSSSSSSSGIMGGAAVAPAPVMTISVAQQETRKPGERHPHASAAAAQQQLQLQQQQQQQQQLVAAQASSAAATTKRADPTGGVASVAGARCVCASYFLVKMCRYSLIFWLPYFLVDAAGLPTASAAKVASLFDLGGVAGSIAVGQVADKFLGGAVFAAQAPFALLTSAILVLFANAYRAGGLPVNAALMLASGFAVAAPDCVLGGTAPRNLCEYSGVDARHAPAVSGLINGIGSVGAIVQGYGTAKLVDALGWQGFFYVLAAAMALSALVLLPVFELERKHLKQADTRTTS